MIQNLSKSTFLLALTSSRYIFIVFEIFYPLDTDVAPNADVAKPCQLVRLTWRCHVITKNYMALPRYTLSSKC
ncbi:Uncharacterized protein TCM_002566 [Theobroma cacao]|uniref:Uncharacterized protein n=1 Tax=Theobroma cacao TaxID=3641 RepID=A0A061DNQ4_THECC|nr:Uncharacterized protein TCM_002566 [Theobroma cacao]